MATGAPDWTRRIIVNTTITPNISVDLAGQTLGNVLADIAGQSFSPLVIQEALPLHLHDDTIDAFKVKNREYVSSVYRDRIIHTCTDNNSFKIYGSTVPAGELWIVQWVASAADWASETKRRIGIDVNGTYHFIRAEMSYDADDLMWIGETEMVLGENDRIMIDYSAGSTGLTANLIVLGYKLNIT